MIYAYKPDGEIVYRIIGEMENAVAQYGDDLNYIESDEFYSTSEYAFRDGSFVFLGARPSPMHRYDHPSGQWVSMIPAGEIERAHRNRLLAESDWTDTLSAKARLGDDLYNAWQTYRQALRDITKQPGYPLDVVWPTPPAKP